MSWWCCLSVCVVPVTAEHSPLPNSLPFIPPPHTHLNIQVQALRVPVRGASDPRDHPLPDLWRCVPLHFFIFSKRMHASFLSCLYAWHVWTCALPRAAVIHTIISMHLYISHTHHVPRCQPTGKKKSHGGGAEQGDSLYGVALLGLSLVMDGVTGAVQVRL